MVNNVELFMHWCMGLLVSWDLKPWRQFVSNLLLNKTCKLMFINIIGGGDYFIVILRWIEWS